MAYFCRHCGSQDHLTTGFVCTRCGTDNLEAVRSSCHHIWEADRVPLSPAALSGPMPTTSKIAAHCLKCGKDYA